MRFPEGGNISVQEAQQARAAFARIDALQARVERLLKLIRTGRKRYGRVLVELERGRGEIVGLKERVADLERELAKTVREDELNAGINAATKTVEDWHSQADKSLAPPPKCKATRDAYDRSHPPCILPEHDRDEPHKSSDGTMWWTDPLLADVEG
jgi:chromosome segregation ATPase